MAVTSRPGTRSSSWKMVATPAACARSRVGEADRDAVEQHLAAVRLDDAGEDVHQRRLPGAVFAEERVNFAALEIEVDAAQRLHAAKALDDAAHGQKRGGERGRHVHRRLDPRRDGS